MSEGTVPTIVAHRRVMELEVSGEQRSGEGGETTRSVSCIQR